MPFQTLRALWGGGSAPRPPPPPPPQTTPSIIRLGAPSVLPLRPPVRPVSAERADTDHTGFQRTLALAQLDALHHLGDPSYQLLARMAAQVCGTPAAAITLLDDTTQWILGSVGVPFRYTSLEMSFCQHALGSQGAPTVMADVRNDPRVAAHPLVTGEPGVRFYAGAPLVHTHGVALGAVCVTDVRARQITPAQVQALQWLAAAAVRLLVLRAPAAHESPLAAQRRAA